jgi:hypothetical protein
VGEVVSDKEFKVHQKHCYYERGPGFSAPDRTCEEIQSTEKAVRDLGMEL